MYCLAFLLISLPIFSFFYIFLYKKPGALTGWMSATDTSDIYFHHILWTQVQY